MPHPELKELQHLVDNYVAANAPLEAVLKAKLNLQAKQEEILREALLLAKAGLANIRSKHTLHMKPDAYADGILFAVQNTENGPPEKEPA